MTRSVFYVTSVNASTTLGKLQSANTRVAQMKIMIDKPQILYIHKMGLQSIVEIVPKIALLEFLKNK
jgi:hypothetical protein